MALRRVRKRRRASITSLIDVIFLLLLFFMLASTFSTFSEIEIASSPSGTGSAGEVQPYILAVGRDTLVLGEDEVSLPHLPSRLEAYRRNQDRPAIAVNVLPEASTQRLIDVLAVLKDVPGIDVQVMEPE